MRKRLHEGWLGAVALVLSLILLSVRPAWTQDPAPAAEDAGEVKVTDELSLRQSQVADKFQRLELLMLKMAEIDAAENPRRAALLRQAVQQSKDEFIGLQLETLVKLLSQEQLKRAVENQEDVQTDLKALLELLQSEDRPDRLKSEQARYREYIREAERILKKQQSLRGRTEGGDDTQQVAGEQGQNADRAGELAKNIQQNEEGGANGQGNSDGNNNGQGDGNSKGDSEGDSKGDSEGDSKGDSEGNSKGDSEGNSKGDSEGNSKGDSEGDSKGDSEGDSKGDSEGNSKGDSEGNSKGDSEGDSKGDSEGNSKGDSEGNSKGDSEGNSKGDSEGNSKGDSEGNSKGDSEGNSKGDSEGNSKGDSEGNSKGNSEGNSKGDSEGDSKGDSQGDSKGDSQGDSQGGSSGGPTPPTPPNNDDGGDDGNPARKRIQAAEQKMREAQQKLEQAKRDESVEAQRQAEDELKKAIAELEEILRQLREEEIERMLAMLEGRFVKMLEMQIRVYEDTIRIDRIPADQRDRNEDIEAGRLSFEERKIVLEADKALTLLREEGSSIAFPEAVEQMRDDMVDVADRLAQTNVGTFTQGLEEEIIAQLEELIEAIRKAQQDMEEQPPQPPQPPQDGQPQDQPLVDQIAELKLIRSMQIRVNSRTQRYAKLLEDPDDKTGQATDDELIKALDELSDREETIQQITRDVVLEKNK